MDANRTANSVRFPSTRLPAGVDGSWIFKVMRSAFDEAQKDHPGRVLEYHCVFGGRIGRLRIIGHKLAEDTLAALGHLIREDAEPVWLKIDLWHECETQVSKIKYAFQQLAGCNQCRFMRSLMNPNLAEGRSLSAEIHPERGDDHARKRSETLFGSSLKLPPVVK